MKKVFVSQPMGGRTDAEILADREAVVKTVESMFKGEEQIEVIDSFLQVEGDHPPLWYLACSIELLSTADLAVFAHGWEDARGCTVEHICAQVYDIPYINL